MLTCMKVKNFKNLEEIEIELGKSVVLIGPNNSGKTNALQALTLWDLVACKAINAKNHVLRNSLICPVCLNNKFLYDKFKKNRDRTWQICGADWSE